MVAVFMKRYPHLRGSVRTLVDGVFRVKPAVPVRVDPHSPREGVANIAGGHAVDGVPLEVFGELCLAIAGVVHETSFLSCCLHVVVHSEYFNF